MSGNKGNLYLIPTRLGDNAPLEVLPISIKRIIESVNIYIVENEKTARAFIKKISSGKPQGSLKMYILNKFTDPGELPSYLQACQDGQNIGLLSEAGCPAIADPGSEIVRIAHAEDIRVIPLVGPSSILLALMSSGMNGQNFAFNGYLPIDRGERRAALKNLERMSFDKGQAQIFMETPYRNNDMFKSVCNALHKQTRVCVACDITQPTEYIKTKTVEEWQQIPLDLHKRPTIFIIQKDR